MSIIHYYRRCSPYYHRFEGLDYFVNGFSKDIIPEFEKYYNHEIKCKVSFEDSMQKIHKLIYDDEQNLIIKDEVNGHWQYESNQLESFKVEEMIWAIDEI